MEKGIVAADVCVIITKGRKIINLEVENMRIVSIFTDKLFSFHYSNQADNELTRLMSCWTDIDYLDQFLEENKKDIGSNSIDVLISQIVDDANRIDDKLYFLTTNSSQSLNSFFKPLHNEEYQFTLLSKRKGRVNYLRLYALKIDDNCYVITGGAIKFTHLMEERKHTNDELTKIDTCKRYLNENGVFDYDSFFEFLNENV